jgi:hypothetical protein
MIEVLGGLMFCGSSCTIREAAYADSRTQNRTIRRPLKGHVRFCVRIAVRFHVRFPAQGRLQFSFQPMFSEMCFQAVVIGDRGIIGTLNPFVCKS